MPRKFFTLAAIVVAVAGLASPSSAQGMPEQFVGNVVNMQGGGTTYITLHIESYTPDAEVQALANTLKEQGQQALLGVMFDLPERGWVKIGPNLGYPITVFRSRPSEKGRTIAALTDRPIQFWESYKGTRSRDYTFGMILLEVDEKGKGEGQLLPAMKASITEDGKVDMESLGTQPFRIIRVRQELPKKK